MYLSDYLYANNGQADKNNWLFIANGLNENHNSLGNEATAPDANTEWTMTRYGRYGYGTYNAWEVMDSNGAVNWYMVDDGTFAVRPVFYLKSTTRISNGNGTIGTPYIIAP